MRSIDELTKIKYLKILRPIVDNERLKKSIRLLCVFGFHGNEVLFVTTEDAVYGLGHNRYGCLGLGVWDKNIPEPTHNPFLSGKQLANIFYGFGHCVGLTADGQCYSWGENDFGQLGIGSFESTNEPKRIRGLPKVVSVSCGNRHTLALTNIGQVWAWGRNTFGQIGDGTWVWRWFPVRVAINDKIASVSCGKCHSLALSKKGKVYVWGLNDFGQLGRHRDEDIVEGKERAFSELPINIVGFDDIVIKKAICGPNHTLLLTTDGVLYSFGLNDKGQVGNNTTVNQFTPVMIKSKMRFKDIITTYDNDLSLAISMTDRHFVWGFGYYYKQIKAPFDITEYNFGYTFFDTYAQYSESNKTFETIVFEVEDSNVIESNNSFTNDLQRRNSLGQISLSDNGSDETTASVSFSVDRRPDSVNCVDGNCSSSDVDPISGQLFQNYLTEVFNNPSDYDLKFDFVDKTLFCHKTILNIRNKSFWQKCEQNLDKELKTSVLIKRYSYEAFYAFVGYLYGIEAEVNDENCIEVLKLANIYNEPELKNRCFEWLRDNINEKNVCNLFTIADNYGLNGLTIRCIDFAANHWKSILRSESFHDMSEEISKKFMSLTLKIND